MINKAILVGNLGRDPETRTAATGTVVATLNIATNERQKDRDGNWEDHTEWHRVVCFGRTAENVAKYLSKGSQVYVEGKIRTRSWEGDDGVKKYTTEVVAHTVRFIGGREGGGGERRPQADRSGFGGGGYSGNTDNDVPF